MATAAKQSICLLHEKGRGAICQHRVFVPISFLQNYALFERRDGAREKSGATQSLCIHFVAFVKSLYLESLAYIDVLLNQVKIGDPMQVFGCIFVILICA